MFFEEVKRTEGSHDEKNRRRSPPVPQATPGSGDVRAMLPGQTGSIQVWGISGGSGSFAASLPLSSSTANERSDFASASPSQSSPLRP